MIWYLIVTVAAVALAFIGGMPFYLLFLVFCCGIIGLGYNIAVYMIGKLKLHREIQRHKAKWGGEFLYVEGLNIIPNQRLYMLILRRDELLFLGQPTTSVVPLRDVDSIVISEGNDLEAIPDAFIYDYLDGEFPPNALANLRNMLRLNRNLRHRDIVIMHVKNPISHKSDLIVLIAGAQSRQLKDFVKRPEIRQKSHKLSVKLYNLKKKNAGKSAEGGLAKPAHVPPVPREEH